MSTIPIYINNRNYLTPVAAMVEYLLRVPGALPIIVDNDSTYPPLLSWYALDCPVEVVCLGENAGPRGWFRGVDRKYPFYVGTDPDLDLTGIPLDVLDLLRDALDANPDRVKVGLGLEIDDVPPEALLHRFAQQTRRWWRQKVSGNDQFWEADLDMTFSMYRTKPPWNGGYGPALRSDRPYTARHLPWYWTVENMTEEERYYVRHCEFGAYVRSVKQAILKANPTP